MSKTTTNDRPVGEMERRGCVSATMENIVASEGDRRDWTAHGLPCRMYRNRSHAWCGYVGVPKDHPWFGKSYSDRVEAPERLLKRDIDVDKVGAINLLCSSMSEDDLKAGICDIVLLIDVHGGLTYSDNRCPGHDDEGLWWFGFDCSHCDDVSPRYDRDGEHGKVYRTADWVGRECESLAAQLSRLSESEAGDCKSPLPASQKTGSQEVEGE